MPLSPGTQVLVDQLAAAEGPSMIEVPPEQGREMYRMMQPAAPHIEVGAVEDRNIIGPAGALPIRIYTPRGEGPFPLHVFYHGGGWVIGDLDTHDADCREICAGAECIVVAVHYRLAPEHPFPAAPEDCYAATLWAAQNASNIGARPGAITVGGDSAGGNLAAVVSQMVRDRGGPEIALQLLVYPVTNDDFDTGSYQENATGYLLEKESMRWFFDLYASEADRDNSLCCPAKASDLSGLPPAMVLTAEFDPLRDEGEAYARALQAAGVSVHLQRCDGLIHGFFSQVAVNPDGREAVDAAIAALKAAHA